MTTNDATAREADRAVPEPDADAVERAARGMFDSMGTMLKDIYGSPDEVLTFEEWWSGKEHEVLGNDDDFSIPLRMFKRLAAGAALQAAAVEPEPGLDELLDSVHPKAVLWTAIDPTGGYAASVRFPKDDREWVTVPATGATRAEAIADAVRQAKGTGGSE